MGGAGASLGLVLQSRTRRQLSTYEQPGAARGGLEENSRRRRETKNKKTKKKK